MAKNNNTDKEIKFMIIGFITLCVVTVLVSLYNTLPSRTQMRERHRAGINFIEAKANYFNARADSLSYLKKCTPESDAMMDIAESITNITSEYKSSSPKGIGFQSNHQGSASSSNSSSNNQ